MHRDRNNNSWSELKAKRNHSEYDDAPLTAANVVQDDLIGVADSRKEKNDRATRQLDGVKKMFINYGRERFIRPSMQLPLQLRKW